MSRVQYEYRVADAEGEACFGDIYTDERVVHTYCHSTDDVIQHPACGSTPPSPAGARAEVVAAHDARSFNEGGHPDCGVHRVQRRVIGAWEDCDASEPISAEEGS